MIIHTFGIPICSQTNSKNQIGCTFILYLHCVLHLFALFYPLIYFFLSGDLLKPSPLTQIHSPGAPLHSGKMLPNDLDSSLANLVGSKLNHSLMPCFHLHFYHLRNLISVSSLRPAVWGHTSQKVSKLSLKINLSFLSVIRDFGASEQIRLAF